MFFLQIFFIFEVFDSQKGNQNLKIYFCLSEIKNMPK